MTAALFESAEEEELLNLQERICGTWGSILGSLVVSNCIKRPRYRPSYRTRFFKIILFHYYAEIRVGSVGRQIFLFLL